MRWGLRWDGIEWGTRRAEKKKVGEMTSRRKRRDEEEEIHDSLKFRDGEEITGVDGMSHRQLPEKREWRRNREIEGGLKQEPEGKKWKKERWLQKL